MAVKNDINVPLVFTIGVTGALLLAVVLVGVRAWFTYEYDELAAEKNAAHVPEELVALKNTQLEHLKGGEWVNDGRGNHAAVTIPIRQAMNLVAAAHGHPATLPAREPVVEPVMEPSTQPGASKPQTRPGSLQPSAAPGTQPSGKGVDGVPNLPPPPQGTDN